MHLSKLLAATPTDFNHWLEKWDGIANRLCIALACAPLLLFFFIQTGQFLCLAVSTAALGVLAMWRIWTALRDGKVTAGRASFLFGCCAPLFIIYAALIGVQQYQGQYCSEKLRQDIITLGCWILCCAVTAGPGGLLGTFIGYFFTGSSWTLFERASSNCRNATGNRSIGAFLGQPFFKPKDLRFIACLTGVSTLCFLIGISIVLRFAAAGYYGLGLIPSTVAQLKALKLHTTPAPQASPYRYEDPLSTE